MLSFQQLQLEDRAKLEPYFAVSGFRGNIYCFGINYIWRGSLKPAWALCGGYLILRFGEKGHYSFAYPAGQGPIKPVLDELIAYAKQENIVLRMGLEAPAVPVLRELYGEAFRITEDRDNFDYIYEQEKLAKLPGKKYHSKRNHVRRFENAGGTYEPIDASNLEECRQMSREWRKLYGCKENASLMEETCAVEQCFQHFFDLGLSGGALRLDGKIAAFCMGEPMREDEFIVHVEKAYHEVEGAYSAINQKFAENGCAGYFYINREDDAGDEGLRKAKLSYKPELLLEKFRAVWVGETR